MTKFPFQKILAVFVIGHISVTTPLIEKCRQNGIALVVLKQNLRPVFYWSSSAEANFLKDRLSARISISDLFNWNQTDNLNTNPYYITTKSSHRDSRYITFGLTYRIGKMSLKHRARSGAGME